MDELVVVKIGGSLCRQDGGQGLRRLGTVIGQLARERPLAIVPGGGPFADTVREYGPRLGLDDATCHFMALLAMDQFAHTLRQLIPTSSLIELSGPESRRSILPGAPAILLSSRYISLVEPAILPQSWAVTADSIAAYLAGLLAASSLILLKSVDVGPELKEPDVDACFRRAIPPQLPVWIINGLHPERLAELMATGHTRGTYLPPRQR